jgi:hypothetical protein
MKDRATEEDKVTHEEQAKYNLTCTYVLCIDKMFTELKLMTYEFTNVR